MAINQFKEIVDKKGYKVDSKDRAIFEKEVAKSYFGLGDADTIEFILYDSSDNLLPQGENGDLVRYIFLDDVTVSRSHAVVEHSVGSNYLVKDVGSLNGTYVDGVVTNEKVLSNGSELHIGKYKLVFFINDKNLFAKL